MNGNSFATAATSGVAATTLGMTVPSVPELPQIEFQCSNLSPKEVQSDLLVLGIFEDSLEFSEEDKEKTKDNVVPKFLGFKDPALKEWDEHFEGALTELVSDDFQAKPGQSADLRLFPGSFADKAILSKRLAVLGLGKAENHVSSADADVAKRSSTWKSVGDAMATLAKKGKAKAVAFSVAPAEAKSFSEESQVSIIVSLATGLVVGSFSDARFKSEKKAKDESSGSIKSVSLLGLGSGNVQGKAAWRGVRLAAGILLTRQLVNAPANVLTPVALADVALSIAAAHADVLSVQILDEKECAALGMGAFLGVAAASDNPPRFIHVTYSHPEDKKGEGGEGGGEGENKVTKLAIIGKGLTFDSGGYNLKAGAGSMIELMKFDMGGAAATLGSCKAIASIQPRGVEVHFLVASCENMISGKGMRPGDVLTASNGKTIEVNNTDAEGRLTLADALVYANKLKVDKIVDLATLTGACIVALGMDIAGMFSPNDGLVSELNAASFRAGEKFWRLPMEDKYWEQMTKSHVADMLNTGGRWGGSITAALFLKQFVDKDIPWAHLDIAGPVWSDQVGGGTGFATGTLFQWVYSHAKDE